MSKGNRWGLTISFGIVAAVLIFFGLWIKADSEHAVKTYTATTTGTVQGKTHDEQRKRCSGSGSDRTCTRNDYCHYHYVYTPERAGKRYRDQAEGRGRCDDDAYRSGARHVVHYDPDNVSDSTTVDIDSTSERSVWMLLVGLGLLSLIVAIGPWFSVLRARLTRSTE